MTTPSSDQIEQLDIKLAALGGLNLASTRQLLTVIGLVVSYLGSTRLGSRVGLSGNERLASLVVAGIVIAAYLLAESLHHAAIEHGNAAVKVAAIQAAATQQTPVILDSPPDVETVTADPVTEPDQDPAVAVPQPPAVGAELPIETVSTSLPEPADVGAPPPAG